MRYKYKYIQIAPVFGWRSQKRRSKILLRKKENKCKIRVNVVKKSHEEPTLLRIFLMNLESDFRVSVLPEFTRIWTCYVNYFDIVTIFTWYFWWNVLFFGWIYLYMYVLFVFVMVFGQNVLQICRRQLWWKLESDFMFVLVAPQHSLPYISTDLTLLFCFPVLVWFPDRS